MDKEIINIQVIFAEDIREEKSGQFSLIGAFQENVEASSFPLRFPKLAMFTLISTRVDAPAIIKDFRVFAQDEKGAEETFIAESFDGKTLEAQNEALRKLHKGQQWASLNLRIAAHGLEIENESQLFLEVTSLSNIKYRSNSLAIQKNS